MVSPQHVTDTCLGRHVAVISCFAATNVSCTSGLASTNHQGPLLCGIPILLWPFRNVSAPLYCMFMMSLLFIPYNNYLTHDAPTITISDSSHVRLLLCMTNVWTQRCTSDYSVCKQPRIPPGMSRIFQITNDPTVKHLSVTFRSIQLPSESNLSECE